MATERSDKAYDAWREASEKFDYFITGVTGALVAFIAENLEPARLGLNEVTIEIASVLLLLGSVVIGFKRIETNVTIYRLTSQRLYSTEARGALLSAFQGTPLINQATGDVYSATGVAHEAQIHQAQVRVIEEKSDELAKLSASLYRWRNKLLISGFLLLVISRILPAYL